MQQGQNYLIKKVRLTIKQENFARKYIECSCASEAYRFAYNTKRMKPETIWSRACEVLKNSKVAARVDQLQEQAQQRHEITFDNMIQMFIEDREQAKQLNQTSAAISADNAIAKMLGFMTEKSEVKIEQTVEVTHKQEEVKRDVMSILSAIEAEKTANNLEDNSEPSETVH